MSCGLPVICRSGQNCNSMNAITIPWSHSQYHAHIHFTVLLWITSHLQFWSESQYHHHIQLKVWLCLTSHLQTRSVSPTTVFTLTHYCVLWITCYLQFRSESQYHDHVHLKVSLCLVDYLPSTDLSGQYHTIMIVFTLTNYCVLWITCHLQIRSASHYHNCIHLIS